MKDASLFLKALHFAADKHRDQRRKDESASPYINHPIYVAQILTDIGGIDDVEVLCGAILHDTVEDTETSMNDIELAFGLRIARIVEEVTDDKLLPKQARKKAQIDHARHISREGALVKVADKIANIRDIASNPPNDWSMQRRKEYLDWAEKVVSRCKPESPELVSYFTESLAGAREGLRLGCA
jgi:guanosine-3',5'-bis(diphosphate) 3'-pyrophosphohydrolase